MRTGLSVLVVLALGGCSAHVSPAPPVAARTVGSCTLEVLSLPPSAPYIVIGQGYSDNMTEPSVSALFEQGCGLGADALVAPLPPESLSTSGGPARLAGTFIRRCPASGCPEHQVTH